MNKLTHETQPLFPSEIFHLLHQTVLEYDADQQAELFASDAVWEFPFAPEGTPHIISGSDRIVAVARTGMEKSKQKGRHITGYHHIKIYETKDPEVIFAEFELHGEIAATGETYQIPYIQLLKVHKGKIVLLRDYFPGEVLKMIHEK